MNISVIIPTYNRCIFLKRAIDSVLAQSEPVQEIIIIDNNSTDGTKILLEQRYPKVRYILEKRKGVSIARNTGINEASCEWVAFLDSDDIWSKQKIATFKEHFYARKHSELIWHSDEIWLRNGVYLNQKRHHKKKGGYIFEDCLKMCCISPSSVLIHRKIFEKFGVFNVSLPVCEDYDLWIRLTSKEMVGFIDKKLVTKFGGHNDQLSKKFWGMDRFRIKSIIGLLRDMPLTKHQEQLAINQLIFRLRILINGATKRKNYQIVSQYKTILNYWLDFDKCKPRFG